MMGCDYFLARKMLESAMDEYYDALIQCGVRYKDMLNTRISDDLYWGYKSLSYTYSEEMSLSKFIYEFIQGCKDGLPLMKLNRWLGYIQGTLIAWGITTVQAERDWTRPLFRKLDFGELAERPIATVC